MTFLEWQKLEAVVRGLSPAEKDRLRALLDHPPGAGGRPPDLLLGLMADEPELVDAVVEAAMIARERDPLRLGRHAEDAA